LIFLKLYIFAAKITQSSFRQAKNRPLQTNIYNFFIIAENPLLTADFCHIFKLKKSIKSNNILQIYFKRLFQKNPAILGCFGLFSTKKAKKSFLFQGRLSIMNRYAVKV
jgi:hypothetical protein